MSAPNTAETGKYDLMSIYTRNYRHETVFEKYLLSFLNGFLNLKLPFSQTDVGGKFTGHRN